VTCNFWNGTEFSFKNRPLLSNVGWPRRRGTPVLGRRLQGHQCHHPSKGVRPRLKVSAEVTKNAEARILSSKFADCTSDAINYEHFHNNRNYKVVFETAYRFLNCSFQTLKLASAYFFPLCQGFADEPCLECDIIPK
jgi:hypothetical protein